MIRKVSKNQMKAKAKKRAKGEVCACPACSLLNRVSLTRTRAATLQAHTDRKARHEIKKQVRLERRVNARNLW